MNESSYITAPNLAILSEEAAARHGERNMLLFGDEFVTNLTILERGRRLQAAFEDLGLARDEIVVVCMENHPLAYSVFLGVLRTAATVTPVMHQLSTAELRYILRHTEAVGVVTDTKALGRIEEAAAGLEHLKWIAVRGADGMVSDDSRVRGLETLLDAPPATRFADLEAHDVALMLYTSGTTGRPKGVMLTHDNLIASGETLVDAAELHLREHPIIPISSLPMAHIFGISLMTVDYLFPTTYAPGYTVQEARFDAGHTLEQIQRHRCTDLNGVPTMLSKMLAHPNFADYDLSSIYKIDIGGAPLPVDLAKRFAAHCGCRIRQRYGMTENTGKGSTDRSSEPWREGAVGRPYHNTEIAIMDEDDTVLSAGETGEVVSRGRTTMKGYFKDAETTAQAIRGGWLHTGDIGYLDEDGWLYVVDRKKDMIIKGGENVYPAEVESVLYENPEVADAAVVGVPHEVLGEDIVAFVVAANGDDPSEAAVIAHARERITPFKAPSRVVFVDALPKNEVGKVIRRELRDRARAMFAESTD